MERRRQLTANVYVEGDQPIPREDPEPITLPTATEPAATRVPVGSTPQEPAIEVEAEAGEHFELPTGGFLGEVGRLAAESSTVKPDTYRIAQDQSSVPVYARPLDEPLPLTVEGDGTTTTVQVAAVGDESRRVETEKP
jgi:hypothetical protein